MSSINQKYVYDKALTRESEISQSVESGLKKESQMKALLNYIGLWAIGVAMSRVNRPLSSGPFFIVRRVTFGHSNEISQSEQGSRDEEEASKSHTVTFDVVYA